MKEYLCDVEKLYGWLPENSKTLSDGSELVFEDGFDGGVESAYCDIISPDGQRVILDGEVHQFVKNNNSWTNVLSENNSATITLTQEEFEILCQSVA